MRFIADIDFFHVLCFIFYRKLAYGRLHELCVWCVCCVFLLPRM